MYIWKLANDNEDSVRMPWWMFRFRSKELFRQKWSCWSLDYWWCFVYCVSDSYTILLNKERILWLSVLHTCTLKERKMKRFQIRRKDKRNTLKFKKFIFPLWFMMNVLTFILLTTMIK